MDRPNFLSEEHIEFLDGLKESGQTNMSGATPYLMGEFPELEEMEARYILAYWVKTFDERKKG